uniref:Myosin regulatory light chain 2, atrial isoform-like n=1 Tax=Pundamilia nyererei TaxID=303518 RepID=A0A3B4FHH4_9CICH
QASKKASNKRQRGGQKSSSNVFSMFEQSQIQEFKELNVKEEELDEMLNEGKGPINFTVFLTLFGEKLSGTDPEDTILAAFKLFDPNGTGFVNKDEFRRLLMNQADKFTAEEVDQAFALAPIDPTGNIDYKSLCYIITHGDEKEES